MKSKLQTLRDLLYENEKKMVFSEAEAPLSVEEKKAFAETLKSFSVMAETVMARGQKLQQTVEQVTKMVETASRLVSDSSDDVVEKVAAGRHIKLMESALKAFQQSANEVLIHERRMEAAFQDITDGLKKYYDVH
jgi:ABC-type transporter Mla subunit MlaD